MPAWKIVQMGGVIPRMDARLIPDNMATEAVNCDMSGGNLVGLPNSRFLIDMTGRIPGGTVEKVYRFTAHDGSTVWLPLPSHFSSVVRSPVVNDTYDRVYWTNPGDLSPHFNTAARIIAGSPPYDLGIVHPTTAPTITGTTGGTAPPATPAIDRAYVYTFVNEFLEESGPSPASNVFSGPPDATWHVTGFPTTAPASPAGRAYPAITSLRIYRTITSATSGAQFYMCGSIPFPWSGTLDDGQLDSSIVLNEILSTTGYGNAPDYLDGLVVMPGGFLAGFTGRDIHFSEPNRPFTWPDVYDQTASYDIVSLAVWQQYLFVLTKGFPSAGSGNAPSNIVFTQSQIPEPCISRGSVMVDFSGCFYVSHNGLIHYTGYAIENMTANMVEKNEWFMKYRASHIIAARHRTQFMAVNGSDTGFLIDYAEARLAFQDLSYLGGVDCIWNDEKTGDTLLCSGQKIYEWDCPYTPPQTYRWKSKQFFTPAPMSLGAAQVELDEAVLTPPPTTQYPLDNGDPAMNLPAGVNAQFRYYAGPKLQLVMVRNLTRQMEIFRLPNGFKAYDHQIEILSRVPVSSIKLATTLRELNGA